MLLSYLKKNPFRKKQLINQKYDYYYYYYSVCLWVMLDVFLLVNINELIKFDLEFFYFIEQQHGMIEVCSQFRLFEYILWIQCLEGRCPSGIQTDSNIVLGLGCSFFLWLIHSSFVFSLLLNYWFRKQQSDRFHPHWEKKNFFRFW
jgi:uncharacterized membrane protein YcgQ (UPF0703/DUF1980 family)